MMNIRMNNAKRHPRMTTVTSVSSCVAGFFRLRIE